MVGSHSTKPLVRIYLLAQGRYQSNKLPKMKQADRAGYRLSNTERVGAVVRSTL